ncbi:hypothetical protein [Nocardia nova]|uniref:hypothetical protein n=1 Tax=Nocardia nova TaxID=37330 RepID=UPI0033ECC54C
MSKKNCWQAISVIAAGAAAAAMLAGCGSDAGSPSGDPHSATVTAAASDGNADPLKASGLAVGIGDKPGTSQVTRPTPDQVTARCLRHDQALTVDITAPNGWHASLEQGSQTLRVENKTLRLPPAEFTTPVGTIEMSKKLSGSGFPLGVTWGRPAGADVEIQVSESAPASWTTTSPDTEFMMFMHVSCRPPAEGPA